MTMRDKLALLTELCEQYNLHFVDLIVWHGHEWAYIGSHYDPTSYIEKLSSDQIESMSPRQIEELVVQCALTEMVSDHHEQV
jgi:hypothetical protein